MGQMEKGEIKARRNNSYGPVRVHLMTKRLSSQAFLSSDIVSGHTAIISKTWSVKVTENPAKFLTPYSFSRNTNDGRVHPPLLRSSPLALIFTGYGIE